MKNPVFRLTLTFCAVLLLAACGEKDSSEQPQPTTPQQQWPAKKINRITYSIGSLDYLTYDFTWEDERLKEISCTMYNGTSLGRTVLEYDNGRLARVYPYDGAGTAYPDGAMYYHYGTDGRMEKQTFLLPLRQTENLCQQTYDEAVPCELVYAYSDDGHVSTVQANKTKDDGNVETSTYTFGWVGGNVTSISCDGQPLFRNMQYDDKPNPLHFPMGMETMGITNLIFEGVLGNSILFLGYTFCWCENNMTTLISGNGGCTYTYDDDGYVLTKAISASGQSSTYTFSYCE